MAVRAEARCSLLTDSVTDSEKSHFAPCLDCIRLMPVDIITSDSWVFEAYLVALGDISTYMFSGVEADAECGVGSCGSHRWGFLV